MANLYETMAQMPVHQQPSAHEMIAQLAQSELLDRNDRKTKLLLKFSRLRYEAMLENIDYKKDRNLSKDSILQLMDCSWIRRSENILITGATGCGKSYLACALGQQACQQGLKVLYLNLNRFIERVALARLDGSFNKMLNGLEKIHLVILDDFGLAPLTQDVKLALLQILEDRYGRKATIIASQIPVAQWHDYINEPTIADAILDRIVPKAHRFDLKGTSLRNKK
ncbi:MAG: IS21-like element helper ATPase IstB [Bacteroidetes bacterium]|nr:IS21-like element helper ATPase IstB [Bacteroidota bacterium]